MQSNWDHMKLEIFSYLPGFIFLTLPVVRLPLSKAQGHNKY